MALSTDEIRVLTSAHLSILPKIPMLPNRGLNPLVHYLRHGVAEGREPAALLRDDLRSDFGRHPIWRRFSLAIRHPSEAARLIRRTLAVAKVQGLRGSARSPPNWLSQHLAKEVDTASVRKIGSTEVDQSDAVPRVVRRSSMGHLRTNTTGGCRRSKKALSNMRGQPLGQIGRRGFAVFGIRRRDRGSNSDTQVPPRWLAGQPLGGYTLRGRAFANKRTLRRCVERKSRAHTTDVLVHEGDEGNGERAPGTEETRFAAAASFRKSLTWDRGIETGGAQEVCVLRHACPSFIYFCDPQSPWQRGTST